MRSSWFLAVLLGSCTSWSSSSTPSSNDHDAPTSSLISFRGNVSVSIAWVGRRVKRSSAALPVIVTPADAVPECDLSLTVAALFAPTSPTLDAAQDQCSSGLRCPPQSIIIDDDFGLDVAGGCTSRAVLECVIDVVRVAATALVVSTAECDKEASSPPLPPPASAVVAPSFFAGADASLAAHWRLPCDFEGTLVVPPTAPASPEGVPMAIEVPLSGGLQRLKVLEKLHHHFLLDDFRGVCDMFHRRSPPDDEDSRATNNDENECVAALTRALDQEIVQRCPLSFAASSSSLNLVVVPRVSLEHSPVVHVRLSEDSDLQRFYHHVMAELLPVLSLTRRMMTTSSKEGQKDDHDGEIGRRKRHLVLHARGRKWGSNPLHGAFDDLTTAIAAAREGCKLEAKKGRGERGACSMNPKLGNLQLPPLIHLVDDGGETDSDSLRVEAAVHTLLPRWDYAWWGEDRRRAWEAAELATAAVAWEEEAENSTNNAAASETIIGGDSSSSSRSRSRKRSGISDRQLLVFQLRDCDPALAAFYKRYHSELLQSGPADFGNQDYSLYGEQRRRIVGLDAVAEDWRRRIIGERERAQEAAAAAAAAGGGTEAIGEAAMGAMGAGAGERPSWDVRIVRGGDGLPLRKQAAQYAQARVLVLGHGAGMVHALWMMRMRRTKGNSSTLRNQSGGNDTDDDIENEDDDVHNNKNDDDQVGHLSSSSPTVIEVGTAEDLKHDYLARITALFGLRHVKVVCTSPDEDVSFVVPPPPDEEETAMMASSKTKTKTSGGGGGCAGELERAIASAIYAEI